MRRIVFSRFLRTHCNQWLNADDLHPRNDAPRQRWINKEQLLQHVEGLKAELSFAAEERGRLEEIAEIQGLKISDYSEEHVVQMRALGML